MIEIRTERLIIRDYVEEDIDGLNELISDEKVMFYLPDIKTKNIDESRENLRISIEEANSLKRTKYFFAIVNKNTHEYIGGIGFTKTVECELGNIMNLGYFIREIYWGKGIVTEASKAIISYAFNNLNTIKITTGCIKNNIGSEKVMKKLGMIKEAEYKSHVLLHSKLYDRVEYRLLKEEWEDLLT